MQSGADALVIPGVFRGCDHRQLISGLRRELPALREVFVTRDEPGADMRSFATLLDATRTAANSPRRACATRP